jgi:hypothetical protein
VYRTSVLPHVSSFTAGLQSSLIPWGKWFRRHAPPGASIAAPDIGAIGYFSGHRVIDLAGLVTPEMVPLLQREPQENAVANLSFAAFARPEFLIDRASVANDMLARSAYAAALEPRHRAAGESRVHVLPRELGRVRLAARRARRARAALTGRPRRSAARLHVRAVNGRRSEFFSESANSF